MPKQPSPAARKRKTRRPSKAREGSRRPAGPSCEQLRHSRAKIKGASQASVDGESDHEEPPEPREKPKPRKKEKRKGSPGREQPHDHHKHHTKKKKKRPNREVYKAGVLVEGSGKRTYKVIELLGFGGFGDVYLVEEASNPEHKYALKTELKDKKKKKKESTRTTQDDENSEGEKHKPPDENVSQGLLLEVEILTALSKLPEERRKHFTALVDEGSIPEHNLNFMVMTLVGPSLDKIRRDYLGKDFAPHSAASASLQSLDALIDLHSIGYLHQDIKPQNFAVGKHDRRVVIMLDFGIARRYKDDKDNYITPLRKGKVQFVGTLLFAARACHEGIAQGPKDDLETWVYLVMDLHRRRSLPWYRSKKDAILDKKKKFCREPPKGDNTMPSLAELVDHLKSLKTEEKPDYVYLKFHLEAEYTKKDINWKADPEYLDMKSIKDRRRAHDKNKETQENAEDGAGPKEKEPRRRHSRAPSISRESHEETDDASHHDDQDKEHEKKGHGRKTKSKSKSRAKPSNDKDKKQTTEEAETPAR